MATTGTITQISDNRRNLVIHITGVTQASNTAFWYSRGYPIGSFTAQGTFGSGGSVQLQGSNDGGTTWFNCLASALTAAGSGGIIGQNNEIFQAYQFAVASGDGTTSLNFYVFMSATFG